MDNDYKQLRIAVLGAGNAGCACAADLTWKGHQVTLIKTSRSMHNENFLFLCEQNGKLTLLENGEKKTVHLHAVSTDLSDIKGKDVIIVYIQTNYHEALIKRIADYIEDNQILLINPGYFSTAYAVKYIRNERVTVVEATSSFIDCRIQEPGLVKVGFRNVRNPVSIYPASRCERVIPVLEQLQYHFSYHSPVEVALHNPNLIVHTVGAIMSIPRIEKTKGDYCMYWEVWTPSVWNILEKLDAEKMDILEALGLRRLAYVDACKYRNTLDDPRSGKEIFMWYAGMPTRAKGPVKVDSRYISEDVPQGLVMLEALGKQLGIATPICTSLIEIASAALGRDMRAEGRTLEKLGQENVDRIISDTRQAEFASIGE